jgi:hypothetical protein
MTRSQRPYQGPINIKHNGTKSGRHGDLAPEICVPLVTILVYYPATCFGLSGHPQGDKLHGRYPALHVHGSTDDKRGFFKIFLRNADPPVNSQSPVRRNWYPEVGAKVNAFSISSRVDPIRKIRDRKQRTDIGKCSFVNGTIKNWNQTTCRSVRDFPLYT